MRARLMRLQLDGKRIWFKRGTPAVTDEAHIEAWKCPECYKTTKRAKCIVSHIQYGFEWDTHTDYFRCRCGCHYYAYYRIWLVEREVS